RRARTVAAFVWDSKRSYASDLRRQGSAWFRVGPASRATIASFFPREVGHGREIHERRSTGELCNRTPGGRTADGATFSGSRARSTARRFGRRAERRELSVQG